MMLLSMNIMAQIDIYDQNWGLGPVFSDNFDETNRQFGSNFHEPLNKWISYTYSLWPSGVTKPGTHQIYQYDRDIFDPANGIIRLNSQFIRSTPIVCDDNLYEIPTDQNYYCDEGHHQLYYESGTIETPPDTKFRYGYFEIRCKLPIHQGAFPAFWLWDAKDIKHSDDPYYEEIDIFEFSWEFEDPLATWQPNPHPHGKGNPYCFTSGIYFCDTADYCGSGTSQARIFPMIADSLSHWHIFSCEWMPEYILWYCDGNLINEYRNSDSIPHHPLTLKTNYAIDKYALEGEQHYGLPTWQGEDVMVIDYIKVYQLNWDCSTDEIITQQSELDGFEYAVKKSISITSAIEPVRVASNEKVTFRATDSFEITGPFQVDNGGELAVIMQECPE